MGIITRTYGTPGRIDRKAQGIFKVSLLNFSLSDTIVKLAGRTGDTNAILSGGNSNSYVSVLHNVSYRYQSESWSTAGASPRIVYRETVPGSNLELAQDPLVEGCETTSIITYAQLRSGLKQDWDFGGGTVGYSVEIGRRNEPTISSVCLNQKSGVWLIAFSPDVDPDNVIIREDRAAFYNCSVERL